MYIKDIISKLNQHRIRFGNCDYFIASKVEDELENLSKRSVSWDVDDFESLAIDTYGDTWEEWIDKDKFEEALVEMIRSHDASIGITWDTVDYYLDLYCKKKYPPIGKVTYKDLKDIDKANEEKELK